MEDSEEAVAAVNNLPVDQTSLWHQLVRSDRTDAVNMEDFMSMSHQPIGDQHAVAMEIDAFGAHVSGAGARCEFEQFLDSLLKFGSQNVIRVIAKAGIAQREIGRVLADFPAMSSERGQPAVMDTGGGEGLLQRFAVEVRQSPGHREGADVDQGVNLMRLERSDEFLDGAGGMTDSVEGRHGIIDS